jgi:dCMP deaminase
MARYSSRLNRDAYYMGIALAVRERANCVGSRVGAVLVLDDRVIATGYNGTPMGMRNCDEGGCERCNDPDRFPSGSGYDVCICVHAEQNTLLTAARFGIAVRGAVLYTTMRPCFGCTKELLQAEVSEVKYLHEWEPPAELRNQYEIIQDQFAHGIRQVTVDDPKAHWALPRGTQQIGDTGHGTLRPERD